MAVWVQILLEIQPAASIQLPSLRSEYEGEKNRRISSQHDTFTQTDFQFYERIFYEQLGLVLGVTHT